MFRGRFEHNLDAKGRLSLPAAFKKALAKKKSGEVIVTTHISSPCLVVYPKPEWEAFEKKLGALPQFDPAVMAVRRLYVGGAMECAIDNQGRVLVPPVLRDYAGLDRDALWVGAIQVAEIWSRPRWNEVIESSRRAVGPDLLEKLSDLGV